MFLIMMFNLITIILSMMILIINMIISKKMFINRNKITSFECGFDNLSSIRLPFSSQFFLISLIFLIFDVEISLIFPIIFLFPIKFLKIKFTFLIILTILIVGLFYEWKEGSLNWIN